MGLGLVLGPANAGKIAHLLDGYLAALDRDPVLIVPNRADVDRVERDLLRRVGALLGGLDRDVRRPVPRARARRRGRRVRWPETTQRTLIARRALAAHARSHGLDRSARFAGFADALLGVARGARGGAAGRSLARAVSVDGDLAPPLRGLSGGARRGRPLGPRPAPPARRRAARARSSTPGTAARSSPTASRT